MPNNLQWLVGDVYPAGKVLSFIIAGSKAGYVEFSNASGTSGLARLIPTNRVPLDQTLSYNQNMDATSVTAGKTLIVTATPYADETTPTADGVAVDITITFKDFDASSGQSVDANMPWVATKDTPTSTHNFWRIAMQAKTGGAALAGAIVKFDLDPTTNLIVYTDDTTPKVLSPVAGRYWAKTQGTVGEAAIRVITNAGTPNQFVGGSATMMGIDNPVNVQVYFISNDDPGDANALWTPPSAELDENDRIQIPEAGGDFNLYVSVNGETGPNTSEYRRWIVFNDDAVRPFKFTNDAALQVPYSTLKASQEPTANRFTYVRQTHAGNVTVAFPFEVGVDGSAVNLPDGQLPNRFAPEPRVIPDPGADNKIGIGTINTYNGLRLSLQNFKAALLPNLDTTKPLTVDFWYYMNGYNIYSDDRVSQVFKSSDGWNINAPAISFDAVSGDIQFALPYVDLPKVLAKDWGRDVHTKDVKKAGFEYLISDGTITYRSIYNDNTSWYYIDTGNW